MAIELPMQPIPAETQDPKFLIIYSKPKVGKTTALANLPNCLIVDTENGSKYLSALKIKVNSTGDIKELLTAIKNAKDPYDFIAIDTATMLEEMCKPMALKMYQATAAGANYTGDILNAPNGSGYGHLRTAVESVIDKFAERTRHVILTCHAKDAAIDKNEITVKQIDLLGKTGRILSAKADAIGYMERDEDSNTILNFNTNEGYAECGARPANLKNRELILGESKSDGNMVWHWDEVYPSLKK